MALTDSQSQRFATQLQRRLDPHGSDGVEARIRNSTTVELLLAADLSAKKLDTVKGRITQVGFLEFRVLANQQRHRQLIRAAFKPADPGANTVFEALADGSRTVVGKWVHIARGPSNEAGLKAYRYIPQQDVVRNAVTGEPLTLEDLQSDTEHPGLALARYLESEEIEDIQVLVFTGDNCQLTGDMISSATSLASAGQSAIDLHFTAAGSEELAKLTASSKPNPEEGSFCKLAVILDNHILAAPRIVEELRTDRAVITGLFKEAEVEEIAAILRSGSHPQDLTLHFREQRLVPASQR